jgi:hypothetical protein
MHGHTRIFTRFGECEPLFEAFALQIPPGLACGVLRLLADGEFGMLQRMGSGHGTSLTHLPETASGFSRLK